MRNLPNPERCNCWAWAQLVWLRFGGFGARRWSDHGLWFHWVWISRDRKEAWSYSPITPHKVPWDFFWFRGEVIPEAVS
jgi:hypothetical protein